MGGTSRTAISAKKNAPPNRTERIINSSQSLGVMDSIWVIYLSGISPPTQGKARAREPAVPEHRCHARNGPRTDF
jgi:hypothetical protein